MRRNKRIKEKGITLVALVITIIILLILAAIAIASLTGENGLFARARQAREETLTAQEDELRRLTMLEAAANLENTTHTDDSTGKDVTVTIPAGFAVSQVEGENTIANGLVIIDKNGNEWVWIEVPESVTVDRATDDEIENALIGYVTEYRDSNYSDTWYEGCGLEKDEYYVKYSEMLQSIKANNGFFIGRYEVGADVQVIKNDNKSRKAYIQQNKIPYNYVACSQAQELSSTLSPTNKKTSSLMFGIQWDLVLKFLKINGKWNTNNDANWYLTNYSSDWGNFLDSNFVITNTKAMFTLDPTILNSYQEITEKYEKVSSHSILLSTGATNRNKVLNIYDLAGNLNEWTLEHSKENEQEQPCCNRGGSYLYIGVVSARIKYSLSGNAYNVGFRSALY